MRVSTYLASLNTPKPKLIRRWLVNPIEVCPQFPTLSNLHKQWITLYIECLHIHELCIYALTRTNPTGSAKPCFAILARAFNDGSEPVGFLWKPIFMCASPISKIGCMGITWSMLVIFRELARTMDEDPQLSYKEYTDSKAQLLLQKREEEACKQRVI